MRRAVLTVLGTIVGLVLLLSFKSQPGAVSGARLPAAISSPLPSDAGHLPSDAGGSATPSPSSSPSPDVGDSTATPNAGAPRATATDFTGSSIRTPYGDVQVRITVNSGKISAVDPLQVPNDRRRSIEISSYAVPQLVQETISAQSAHIDMISGATYTSEGYQQSLQSALDKAGIK